MLLTFYNCSKLEPILVPLVNRKAIALFWLAKHSLGCALQILTWCLTTMAWPHPLILGEDLVVQNNRKTVISNQIAEWPIRGIHGLRDVTLSRNLQIQHGK